MTGRTHSSAGPVTQAGVLDPAPSDEAIGRELAEIGDRLAGLARQGGDADTIGPELGAIRAQLRLLAEQNAEVGARLAVTLGLRSPER